MININFSRNKPIDCLDMGNLNSSQLKPLEKDTNEEISAPMLDQKSKITADVVDIFEDTTKKNIEEKLQEKGVSRNIRRNNLDDMIINKQNLLPKEFTGLEELKTTYLAQREKKSGENVGLSLEWEMAGFKKNHFTCFFAINDEKYIIAGTYNGRIIMLHQYYRDEYLFKDENLRKIHSISGSEDYEYIVASIQRDLLLFHFITKEQIFCLKNVHDSDILSVIISKDKKFIVTGAEDGSIKIFDLVKQNEVHHFANIHQGPIYSMTFSRDNSCFISASQDGSLKIFEIEAKKEIHHFSAAHKGAIFSVIVSYDNNYIITGSADHTLKMFDLKKKKEVYHFEKAHDDEVYAVAVSSDNRYIYSSSKDSSFRAFDLQTKQETKKWELGCIIAFIPYENKKFVFLRPEAVITNIYSIEERSSFSLEAPNRDYIKALAISDENSFIVTGSKNGLILVFDFQSRQSNPSILSEAGECVEFIAISSRNKYVICHGAKSIRLFDLKNLKQIMEFPSHNNSMDFSQLFSIVVENVLAATISHDERFLAIGFSDSLVRVFEIQELQQRREASFELSVEAICFSRDLKYSVFALSDGRIKVHDFNTDYEVFTLKSTTQKPFKSVIISENNKYIVCSSNIQIKVLNLETKQIAYNLQFSYLRSIHLAEDNKTMLLFSQKNSFDLWNLEVGRIVHSYQNFREDVYKIAVSKDNKFLVTSPRNGSPTVMRLNGKNEPYKITGNLKELFFGRTSFNRSWILDDGSLVLALYLGSIHVYNLETKEKIRSFELGCEYIYYLDITIPQDEYDTIAMARNGSYIVFGHSLENVKIFNFKTEKEEHSFHVDIANYMSAITISQDGKFMAVVDSRTSISIFDLDVKQQIKKIITPKVEGESICISSDNKFVVAGCYDFSIEIYDLHTIEHIYSFKEAHKSAIRLIIVSSVNKYLISGARESIKIFSMETKQEVCMFQGVASEYPQLFLLSSDEQFLFVSFQRSIKIIDLLSKIEYRKIPTENGQHMSTNSKYIFLEGRIYPINFGRPEEFNYISPKIPHVFAFPTRYDDFLISPWFEDADTRRRYLLYYQDMYVAPYNWTALHLLAIFNPHAITQIPEYSGFQVPFLIDHYGRTPLHYLLAQKNYDYTIINFLVKYILDYLEDKNRVRGFEYQKICSSLSDCFLFIVSKVSPRLADKYLHFCYPETFPQYNQVIPAFGNSTQSYIYSQLPVISSESLLKLHQEGDDRIIFCTNMIYLDYNPRSNDMLMTTHVFSELEHEAIFKIPIIENLIDHLWDSTKMTMQITALAFSALIILLSLYIGLGQPSVYLEIGIIFLTTAFIASEGIQFVHLGVEYFRNIWNYIDITQLLLTMIFMFMKIFNEKGISSEAWIVSIIIITGYLRWLSYLRLFTPTRILIEIILAVLYDMLGFITIIASILIGFSLIFLEFGRNQQDPEGYGFHFYNTFKLLFGNYDDTEYTLSQKILVSSLLCVLNVVLLNLLIAIIGDSYGKIQEGRDLIDAKTRLDMIQEAMILMRTLAPKKDLQKGYLIYKLPALSEEGDTQIQEWEARMNKIEKTLQKSKDEQQENLNNQMKSLGDQIYQIKNEVKKNAEQQTNQIKNEVKKAVEQQTNQIMESIVEVKNSVDKQVKNMANDVGKVQDDMQGLKELVIQVLNNLNEATKKSNLSSS